MTDLATPLKKVIIWGSVGLLLLSAGCSTQIKYGAVKIDSAPEGAEVVNLKDDSQLGTTPVKVSFPGEADTAEYVTVQLRKPGYLDRITSFWVNMRHDSAAVAEENAVNVKVQLEKEKQN